MQKIKDKSKKNKVTQLKNNLFRKIDSLNHDLNLLSLNFYLLSFQVYELIKLK